MHPVVKRLTSNKQQNRATRSRPCPLCGKPDWCIHDANAVLCARSNGQGAVAQFGSYGYLHLLSDDQPDSVIVERPRQKMDDELHEEMWVLTREYIAVGKDMVPSLAREWHADEQHLRQLFIGWNEKYRAWTIPEWNHKRRIVGIGFRLGNGKKLQEVGGRRGLVYVNDWRQQKGTVIIVEGASDVVAGLTKGMCVIGRPSCRGGAKYLGEMLRYMRRSIVIMGENDRKPHASLSDQVQSQHDPECKCCMHCWPGKAGAEQLRKRLREEYGIRSVVAFPNGKAKDIRELFDG